MNNEKHALNNSQSVIKDCPIHTWFELSYSSYLVLHRSLMEGMSHTWKDKMVKLLRELDNTYDTDQIPNNFWVRAKGEDNKFIHDPYREYRRPVPLPYKIK